MRIGAVVPVRQTSSRLPGKHMMKLGGVPSIQRVIERLQACKSLNEIVIATTLNDDDDCIASVCDFMNVKCFRGSEHNLLERTLEAAKAFGIDVIVDVTADEPLIYWQIVDSVVGNHIAGIESRDMTMNILTRTFPRGQDVRVINTKTLERVQSEVDNDIDRGHGGYTWLYLNPKGKEKYKCVNVEATGALNRADIEITLDTQEDYDLINWLYNAGHEYRMELTCEQVIGLIDTYPYIYEPVKSKVVRKDYLTELNNWYEIEGAKNEKVQLSNCGMWENGMSERHTGKRKRT